jgi:hypothetical protein
MTIIAKNLLKVANLKEILWKSLTINKIFACFLQEKLKDETNWLVNSIVMLQYFSKRFVLLKSLEPKRNLLIEEMHLT